MRKLPLGVALEVLSDALSQDNPALLKKVWRQCQRTLLDKNQEKLAERLGLRIRERLVVEINKLTLLLWRD